MSHVKSKFPHTGRPQSVGLYDDSNEHDSCGLGFVANIKGIKSNQIVNQALTVLKNLLHRGATGSETNTGDGAGILIQIPDEFLRQEASLLDINLPPEGHYGTGFIFLPNEADERDTCLEEIKTIIKRENQQFLGLRNVPTDDACLGHIARSSRPYFTQIFIGKDPACRNIEDFERKLYVIRKTAEHVIWGGNLSQKSSFYLPSLSCKTLVYKGMLIGDQLELVFPDLKDPRIKTALALVHQRFSTNTFPSWPLAQPFRFIAHNGEINTVKGNSNWMKAREALCESSLLGDDLRKLFPIVLEGNSDTASFDQVLEFLHMAGRPLPLAILMMVPEAWSGHDAMDKDRKAFYEYHSCMMEAWDGPASISFTDGSSIGAILDRNGLRPSRYYVTNDDVVIMASEAGVLQVPPENIKYKGRLQPGRIFLVDTKEGRIIEDAELKERYINQYPYAKWLEDSKICLDDLPQAEAPDSIISRTLVEYQASFGYSQEDLRMLISPMAENGSEAIGSMGTDTALAVLSNRPRLLYDYFKQLFAQVTNPPLDGIREKLVTQVSLFVGPEHNLLAYSQNNCSRLFLDSPILKNQELATLSEVSTAGFLTKKIDITYSLDGNIEKVIDEIAMTADTAAAEGYGYIILSDRNVGENKTAIPSALIVSKVHQHLVETGNRAKVGLMIESGEPREVHHFAVLLGFGADAINPYLAMDSIETMLADNIISINDVNCDPYVTAIENYIKAINTGLIKIMSKMGISTIQSYKGAQIFEAVGLDNELVEKYFPGTSSKISGVNLKVIENELKLRHSKAWPSRTVKNLELESGGEYQWRRDGEHHLFNPETVFKLQHSTRSGQYSIFKEYTRAVDDQSENRSTLRGLFKFRKSVEPIDLSEVESEESIMKRFHSGAMSYGSISSEAHETLAIGLNRVGGRSNTGEGGEDPKRFSADENGDSKRSAIKQIASGRFGVTSEYLVNADDLQIKMAQGAKPGEGGQLPGHKVYPWIAKVRHSTPGVGLISPPPHHDIYSIEDLAQLIHDLKNANPNARIHTKLVSEVGVGTVAAGVAKAFSDVILISGYDGGTGASPVTSLKHTGVPWELGLAETQQTLILNNLRDRVVVQVDGQMKTGRDCIIAAMLGAEEYGFSTAPLVVMGCVMMRVCHLNTCPVGVATQDPQLRKKFSGKPEFVENFFRYIAAEMREYMASLGIRRVEDLVGRSDLLDTVMVTEHWKAEGLDLSPILHRVENNGSPLRNTCSQDHNLDKSLDRTKIIPLCKKAIEQQIPVNISLDIRNINRTVGTLLGSEITRRYGGTGLPEDTIKLHFTGSAGQSFSAFMPKGVSMHLEGDSNDYIGKGLSGGKIVVYPDKKSTFIAEDNIIIGNVALYGATDGEAYFRGIGGERFAVRNSGAKAVIEGIGDHGCEYMTGGIVAILGETGRNFGAGMSGGVAFVYDPDKTFQSRCNMEMILLEPLQIDDQNMLKNLIENHAKHTGSTVAINMLKTWPSTANDFIKVMPKDYKRVLQNIEVALDSGLSEEDALLEAMNG